MHSNIISESCIFLNCVYRYASIYKHITVKTDHTYCIFETKRLSRCCAYNMHSVVIQLFKWTFSVFVTLWWCHQIFSALLALCAGNSPVNFPHKGQWHGALVFSFICVWTNGWVHDRDADDLRCYGAHYDVTIMHACNGELRDIVFTIGVHDDLECWSRQPYE